ncbi:hypothetical protein QUA62_05350 [Microcoleus sp. MON1_C1]|uniref:hypothetical protein n=1 Tax=Microcoleus sp. MON1_C1 TaxID=2818827 RepID=UPI002FCFD7C8
MEKKNRRNASFAVDPSWLHSDRSNQLVVRSKQPPDATASLRISTDGRGFYNVTIALATALFMALHNSGGILIVLWDGLSSPEGVYFHSRLDANPYFPQESSSNCTTPRSHPC